MPESNRLNLSYPVEADENDVPADVLELVNDIDAKVVAFTQGEYADRPDPGTPGGGVFFWSTDYRMLFWDDGVQWQQIVRSVAWTDWTPTFTAVTGGNLVQPDVTVTVTNLTARYRLISAGTQVELYLRATVKFSTPASATGRSGVRISLPMAPIGDWVLDADCHNDGVRAIAVPQNSGTIQVFRLGSADFPHDNVGQAWRITGVYEIADPGGVSGEVPELPEGSEATPSGPANGDLEGTYPNPSVKDEAVRRHRLDQMAKPTADLDINTNKLTNVVKGTAATDAATMDNIADVLDVVADLPALVSNRLVISPDPPENPEVNDLWGKVLPS